MTPLIFERLLESLRSEPLTLEGAHAVARESGSNWTVSQLRLFLECIDGVEVECAGDGHVTVRIGARTEQEELAAAILEIARSRRGQPLPAAAIRQRLPGKFLTTDEQIRSLARGTAGLEVFGPGLIKTKD
jgi:hypothetical protein